MATRKKVVTVKDPAVAWAEALLDRLRTGLLEVEQTLTEMIAHKVWEPLGFASFTDMWAARMSDITIAAEIRPLVAYEMFRDGSTPEDVAAVIKGLGGESAARLREEQENGVPANLATGRSRNSKGKRDPYATLFVRIQRSQLTQWRAMLREDEETLEGLTLRLLVDYFDGASK